MAPSNKVTFGCSLGQVGIAGKKVVDTAYWGELKL